MATLLIDPFFQVLDSNGKPVSNAKIYVRDGGTTDLSDVYSEIGLSTTVAQPIRTNSAGRIINASNARIGLYVAGGQLYKVTITTSSDAAVDELDLIPGNIADNGGVVPVANGGTNASTAATARTSLGAAAATDLTTLSSTVTTINGQITALDAGTIKALAGFDDVTTDLLASGFGSVIIQRALVDSETSVVTCSTAIPADDTIPQSTEGTEILSGSFTPVSASSTLEIEVFAQGGVVASTDRWIAMALFQDSSANAIATVGDVSYYEGSANATTTQLVMKHRMSSPGTSAVTFAVRVGPNAGTFYVNGVNGGGRLYGGTVTAYIYITEYLAV